MTGMATKRPKGLGMGLEALLGPKVYEPAPGTAQPPNSLKLSQLAGEQKDAEFVVFCGVHFMAESADIICNRGAKQVEVSALAQADGAENPCGIAVRAVECGLQVGPASSRSDRQDAGPTQLPHDGEVVVILPDLSAPPDQWAHAFKLAHIAFRTPYWADFIVDQPTPLEPGAAPGDPVQETAKAEIPMTYHYSGQVHKTARNVLMALEEE